MKIAFITVGTRGDVQPYIAVSRALMDRGHEVWIGASEEHEPLVRAYGIDFRRVGPNFRDLMQTDLGRAWLTSGDSPRTYARLGRQLFIPLQRAYCEDTEAAVEGADGVAHYMFAFGAHHAAERRGLPSVGLAPWPTMFTGDMPPFFAPKLDWMPRFAKRWLAYLFVRAAFDPLAAEHQAHRARVALAAFSASNPYEAIIDAGVPTITLVSEHVLPRPRDWGERHSMAGYAFAPSLPYEPPPSLARFLERGETPIYLGFGSMTGFGADELAALATGAARRAGVRAVIASGWSNLTVESSDDVYVVDEIPHDWLFPRVAAVVHHGGASTFAEGLRAGKPTVIAAFFGDQPFWGFLNERLGTGPRTLLRKSITETALTTAIRAALDGPYAARAREIGERLRAEDGAAKAAARIEAVLTKQDP